MKKPSTVKPLSKAKVSQMLAMSSPAAFDQWVRQVQSASEEVANLLEEPETDGAAISPMTLHLESPNCVDRPSETEKEYDRTLLLYLHDRFVCVGQIQEGEGTSDPRCTFDPTYAVVKDWAWDDCENEVKQRMACYLPVLFDAIQRHFELLASTLETAGSKIGHVREDVSDTVASLPS